MKHLKIMLLAASMIFYVQASGQDSTRVQILVAHQWKSTKTLNNGKDVTGKAEPLVWQFSEDGKSKATSSVGTSNGTWALEGDGKVFVQEKVIKWDVVELTNKSFRISQKQGRMTMEIWFVPAD